MEKQNLEYAVSSASQSSGFKTHIGSVEGARRVAVRQAREEFAEWQTGHGPTITIREAVSKKVVEEFPL